MASPNADAKLIGFDHATRLLGSLEPASIVRAFQEVCSELLGPCDARVFTFVPDDRSRIRAFGDALEGKPIPAPAGAESDILGAAMPINAPAVSPSVWRAHVVLKEREERVGILEVAFGQPLGGPAIDVLHSLAAALAIAVRNGQALERVTQLTFTDDLTALYNSRFMSLYLERELKRCRRTRASLSLLFMDLDGFKSINDTHGHLAGSRTLVEVGTVLESTVRDADILIRYGGDEFVILFPETPLSGGLVIAERIRQVIGNTKFLESQQIEARVSASIGIAAYPESADDVRGLISCADRAMYAAKALGKNRVVAASPLSSPESLKRP